MLLSDTHTPTDKIRTVHNILERKTIVEREREREKMDIIRPLPGDDKSARPTDERNEILSLKSFELLLLPLLHSAVERKRLVRARFVLRSSSSCI